MTDSHPKSDLKKSLDEYQAQRGVFRSLIVPPTRYLMVDGHGDPNSSPDFFRAIDALYPVAYKLKFASKITMNRDFVVMPLEGLWWSDDMASFTAARDKTRWDFTLMIMQPAWITPEMFTAAAEAANVSTLRFEILDEGQCIQTLHVGTFDNEAGVLAELHDEYIPAAGLVMTGKHHEIYLSDRRRVAPHRMRTILRQPVITAYHSPLT